MLHLRPAITRITFGVARYLSSIAARAAARFSGVSRPRFSTRIILRTEILHPRYAGCLGFLTFIQCVQQPAP
jgi:hypothetical protein